MGNKSGHPGRGLFFSKIYHLGNELYKAIIYYKISLVFTIVKV
nr:MAG TPA: hypothetical protein [Caudoviricetes sp.]